MSSVQTESLINTITHNAVSSIKFSLPAKVVGIQNLKDGLIDVLPLVNFRNKSTMETYEHGTLNDIRVVFPSTKTTTICFPITQGDTVHLIFNSVNIDKFVNGTTDPHNPNQEIFNSFTDCVAYVGFEPYQQSCMNPNNYKNDFDNQDLNIVHNKNTDNEVILKLTSEGELKIKSPQKVFVESPEVHVEADNVTVDAQTVDAKNSVIKTYNDVEIKGKSVYQFMTTHTHSGVQSGNSNTAPPNPI